jgi:tetratricopeptide (TPR) repeat protein
LAKSITQPQTGQRKFTVVLLVLVIALAALAGEILHFTRSSPSRPKEAGTTAAVMHYEAGLNLAREGNMTGAANEWQTAIGLDPGYAKAYQALVSKQEQEGDLIGAVKQLDALRRGNAYAAHIVCRQAGLYLKANQYETAVTTAREAVKLEPDCPQAHTMLGAVLAKAGDWVNASREFQVAHDADPTQTHVTVALAVVLGHSGKADQAISLLEGLPASERQSARALYTQGWLLAEYGRNGHKDEKAALELLQQALAKSPADADANTEAGNILLRQGDLNQARTYFEKALHSDTTQAVAARGMATIFARQNLAEAARAKQIADTLEKRETDLREARGRFLTRPDDTKNALRLAELEAHSGNRPDALVLITRTLQTDPNNANALSLLHRLTTRLHN